ncbi:hypothetical protein Tco_0563838, partial [Tanacetum coccineum]
MKHTKPDEDPQLDQPRLKTRKTSKDAEPSKGYKSKESKSISSKGTKSQLKSSGKSTQAEELVFEVADTRTCKSHVELEYNFEECNKAVTGRLDWNNPEGSLEDTTDPSSRIYTLWEANTKKRKYFYLKFKMCAALITLCAVLSFEAKDRRTLP